MKSNKKIVGFIFVVILIIRMFTGCSDGGSHSSSSMSPSSNNSSTSQSKTPSEDDNIPSDLLCSTILWPSTGAGRDWAKTFEFPTEEEIALCSNAERAPYIAAWLNIGNEVKYDGYCVDIRADYLPYGTYCSIANFCMDLSSLRKQYASVSQEYHISGYAGLQMRTPEQGAASIMSFWDIFCTDDEGNKTVIRAKRTYPETTDDGSFTNEGTGAHTISPYPWVAGRWYRMLLKCGTSSDTGNTTVEQWVMDLESGRWTRICTYDTGISESCFVGSCAFFLENYLSKYAGDIRSMEITNVRIHTLSDNEWHGINSVKSFNKQFGAGSWQAGTKSNSFFIITTGVTGKGEGVIN